MKQGYPLKASLILAAGVLGGCPMSTDPEPTEVVWKDIQADMVVHCGAAMVMCHSATAANSLKINTAPGNEMANYQSAKAHINLSAPEMSRLVTYPNNAMHGGGKITGFESPTAPLAKKWIDWIRAGAKFQ
ncbi:MAG: hypothetical protein NZ890_11965 [Myxococcota bacterium]|nr:hypothetical protein [Myxococcota bacterium]